MNYLKIPKGREPRGLCHFRHMSTLCAAVLLAGVLTGCAGVGRLAPRMSHDSALSNALPSSSTTEPGIERGIPDPPRLTTCSDGHIPFNGNFVRFCYPPALGTATENYTFHRSATNALDSVYVTFSQNELLLSLLPVEREPPDVTDAPSVVSWMCLRALKPSSANASLKRCFSSHGSIHVDSVAYSYQGTAPKIQAQISSSEPYVSSPFSHVFLLLPRYNVQLLGSPVEEQIMSGILATLETN
jgi:hypothetical protein